LCWTHLVWILSSQKGNWEDGYKKLPSQVWNELNVWHAFLQNSGAIHVACGRNFSIRCSNSWHNKSYVVRICLSCSHCLFAIWYYINRGRGRRSRSSNHKRTYKLLCGSVCERTKIVLNLKVLRVWEKYIIFITTPWYRKIAEIEFEHEWISRKILYLYLLCILKSR
jgi:hypothetical protein